MQKQKPKCYKPHNELICDQNDKKQYMLHYRNLKYYIKMGRIAEKIHCVISFNQKPCLGKYIAYCREKRIEAKTDFKIKLFKTLLVSFFGETMDQLKKRNDIKLIRNADVDKIIKSQSKLSLNGIYKTYKLSSSHTHIRERF